MPEKRMLAASSRLLAGMTPPPILVTCGHEYHSVECLALQIISFIEQPEITGVHVVIASEQSGL